MPWSGTGKRRVALSSIQDVFTDACEGYLSIPDVWTRFPYVSPAFRGIAASVIDAERARAGTTDPRHALGFYDGAKREWLLDSGPDRVTKPE